MVVEVKDIEVYLIEDENGELITFKENGLEYYAAEIEYHLGKILEKPKFRNATSSDSGTG